MAKERPNIGAMKGAIRAAKKKKASESIKRPTPRMTPHNKENKKKSKDGEVSFDSSSKIAACSSLPNNDICRRSRRRRAGGKLSDSSGIGSLVGKLMGLSIINRSDHIKLMRHCSALGRRLPNLRCLRVLRTRKHLKSGLFHKDLSSYADAIIIMGFGQKLFNDSMGISGVKSAYEQAIHSSFNNNDAISIPFLE